VSSENTVSNEANPGVPTTGKSISQKLPFDWSWVVHPWAVGPSPSTSNCIFYFPTQLNFPSNLSNLGVFDFSLFSAIAVVRRPEKRRT
jgi:hypothetical protein